MSTRVRRRVVKLGGSLLSWPAWRSALIDWLQQQPAVTIIVVGGGRAVDELRTQQPRLHLSDEEAHWRSVKLMSRNASEVARSLDCPLTNQLNDRHPIAVLDAHQLLSRDVSLPSDWKFTSDSIAAYVAQLWKYHVRDSMRLTLLKSCRPEDGPDIESWVTDGLVDERFASFATGLDVEWVCLRDHAPQSCPTDRS